MPSEIHSLRLKCNDRSYTADMGTGREERGGGAQELYFWMSSFTSILISTSLIPFSSGKAELPHSTEHQEASRKSRKTQDPGLLLRQVRSGIRAGKAVGMRVGDRQACK